MDAPPPPPHASLVQELLLALVGHTGDVFVDTPAANPGGGWQLQDPSQCTVRLASDIDWVNSSDRCAHGPPGCLQLKQGRMSRLMIGGLHPVHLATHWASDIVILIVNGYTDGKVKQSCPIPGSVPG